MHKATLIAIGGDVDFPMLYTTLNSWTRMFTGARLRVGTPAWLKHAINPAETSMDVLEHVYEMPLASQLFKDG